MVVSDWAVVYSVIAICVKFGPNGECCLFPNPPSRPPRGFGIVVSGATHSLLVSDLVFYDFVRVYVNSVTGIKIRSEFWAFDAFME